MLHHRLQLVLFHLVGCISVNNNVGLAIKLWLFKVLKQKELDLLGDKCVQR